MRRLVLASLLLAAACTQEAATSAAAPAQVTLEPAWTLSGLANPESVTLGADGTVLYVSNVAGEGEAKDGNGFIARVSRDGALIQRDWATGLDAPKGMALLGARLFVTDIDRIVEIDTTTGQVVSRTPVPGAVFLNDAALLADGTVLVSDSGSAQIFAFKDGRVERWAASETLQAVNGLLPEGDHVIVSTMQGRLLSVDVASKAITVIAENLGDADGIAALSGGDYLVSEWPGRLFVVRADGASEVIMDTRAQPVLLNDFLLLDDLLLIPNWEPGSLSAYRVRR